jgi:hypothetical protein
MLRGIPLLVLAGACAAPTLQADDLDGLNEAVGVNLTVEEGFGARHSGMGITFPTFQTGADAVGNAPAAMNDVDDFSFSTAHAEKFGTAQFDHFAFILPFESHSTMGLGVSRYGVSDIEYRPEGSNPLASQPAELFSVADYLLVGAFARRWGGLDLGFHLDVLYRHLDQDGLGMRADGMAQYTWDGRYRVAALAKGLIPSTARWESGYAEYEVPDLHLGGAAIFPAPYFYGALEVAAQTEGMFAKRAKSESDTNSGRAFDKPFDLVKASNVGMEFRFDFGLAVRLGLQELAPRSFASSATFGAGYSWRRILGIDYSFTPHPDLLATHRISLQLTPAFPKLNGRGFRPRSAIVPATAPSQPGPIPDEEEGVIEEHIQEDAVTIPPAPPASPPATGLAPAPQPDPASVPAPAAAPAPAQVLPPSQATPAKPAASPAQAAQPPKVEKEVLEVEEEAE